jgi:rhodanese-related sulfurtransferase
MDFSFIINILIYGMVAWFLYTRFAPMKGLRNLMPQEFQDQIQQDSNHVLLDVREPHEYKGGYIPGACNMPLSQMKHRFGEIPKEKNVYIYCQSGMRSKQAARILSKNGFSNLAHLQGGISSWCGKIKK